MLKTVLVASFVLGLPASGLAQTVDELVARNAAARGGDKAWRAVSSLRLTGQMDVGHGKLVPYVLEQKKPGKMRLEIDFAGQTAIQCFDGKEGWKVAPYRGVKTPRPLSGEELREAAGPADLYGPLFDYASRGHVVELQGREKVEGRDTYKLKVTLPAGAVRWVYLDAASALEVKVEAVRRQGTRGSRVQTYYHDWRPVEGLLIPHRYETRADGSKDSHRLTVETARVNPALDDSRFAMKAAAPAGGGSGR